MFSHTESPLSRASTPVFAYSQSVAILPEVERGSSGSLLWLLRVFNFAKTRCWLCTDMQSVSSEERSSSLQASERSRSCFVHWFVETFCRAAPPPPCLEDCEYQVAYVCYCQEHSRALSQHELACSDTIWRGSASLSSHHGQQQCYA